MATTTSKVDRAEQQVRVAVDNARKLLSETDVRRIVEQELNRVRNAQV